MANPISLADVEAELASRGLDSTTLDAQILKKADQVGAPSRIRAVVGGFSGEDKIKVLRQFYPDAEPVGVDNFVFTNPDTGKLTVYDPSGLDFADVASVTQDILKGVGGTVGAGLGATAGSVVPGPGTLAGAVGGAALGTAAGQALFDAFVPTMGIDDPRGLGSRAADLGMAAVEGGVGQAGGAVVVAGIKGAVKGAIRGGKAGAEAIGRAIDEFGPTGAVPSAGVASGSRFLQGAESALSKFAGSAGVMAKAAKDTASKIEGAVSGIATKMGDDLDKTRLGSLLQRGIEGPNGFMKKFRLVQKSLYAPVDKAIKADELVALPATTQALEELIGKSEAAQALANDTIKRFNAALTKSGGTITYGELADLRSIVGAKLSDGGLVTDLPRQQLKRLYAALSDDTRAIAETAGVGKELALATKHSNAGFTRIETFLDDLVKKAEPEKAVDYALSGTEQGATRLNAIYKSLGDDEKGALSAYVLRGLGTPKAGVASGDTTFSTETFLTNWNKLSPQAKEVLFGTEKFKGLRGDLDKIADAIGKMRDAGGVFKNPSGTAGASSLIGTGIAGGAGAYQAITEGDPSILGGLVVGIAAARGGAKLMTNPAFVKWLAKSTEISPNGIAAHIGRLSAIAAASDSDSKEAIKEYLGLLGARDERVE